MKKQTPLAVTVCSKKGDCFFVLLAEKIFSFETFFDDKSSNIIKGLVSIDSKKKGFTNEKKDCSVS